MPPPFTRATRSEMSICAQAISSKAIGSNTFASVAPAHATSRPRVGPARSSGERDGLELEGELTIRDVTRPVVLDVRFMGEGVDPWGQMRVGFEASTKISRRDYGLTWNAALETGGFLVGDEVEIHLDVQAVENKA